MTAEAIIIDSSQGSIVVENSTSITRVTRVHLQLIRVGAGIKDQTNQEWLEEAIRKQAIRDGIKVDKEGHITL